MNQFRAGKYHEAAAEFQELVDTSPNYDFGYYMLGLSFLQVKKPADAEKNLLKAIELNGDKFEYHHALAKTYYDQKQYPKAVAALKTAEGLATEAKYKYALYSLRGLSYSAEEKWADAIEDLEEARKIKASAAVLDRLALAYYELGYNDKALPLMRESLKQTPNTAMQVRLTNTLLNMGAESRDAAAKAKYYEEAMVLADKLRTDKPNSADANNLAGRAALGAKKYPQAEAAFKKVLALDSDHCYAMANLGKTYLAQKKWTDAEGILNDATKCAPRMDVAWDSLGFALQKQKRLPDA
ncbi:MAG: tetratricopeptide repeat protein, partial [Pseudomonadales bacterium]|nr:tetratricopeptide repeat protein [Pseudomonadales bacterium]NIX09951.1 tetratricopeptide repeat protein [Pseudomonadales bacterium]